MSLFTYIGGTPFLVPADGSTLNTGDELEWPFGAPADGNWVASADFVPELIPAAVVDTVALTPPPMPDDTVTIMRSTAGTRGFRDGTVYTWLMPGDTVEVSAEHAAELLADSEYQEAQ